MSDAIEYHVLFRVTRLNAKVKMWELALLTGIPLRTIQLVERGQARLPQGEVRAVALALEVPYKKLWEMLCGSK